MCLCMYLCVCVCVGGCVLRCFANDAQLNRPVGSVNDTWLYSVLSHLPRLTALQRTVFQKRDFFQISD